MISKDTNIAINIYKKYRTKYLKFYEIEKLIKIFDEAYVIEDKEAKLTFANFRYIVQKYASPLKNLSISLFLSLDIEKRSYLTLDEFIALMDKIKTKEGDLIEEIWFSLVTKRKKDNFQENELTKFLKKVYPLFSLKGCLLETNTDSRNSNKSHLTNQSFYKKFSRRFGIDRTKNEFQPDIDDLEAKAFNEFKEFVLSSFFSSPETENINFTKFQRILTENSFIKMLFSTLTQFLMNSFLYQSYPCHINQILADLHILRSRIVDLLRSKEEISNNLKRRMIEIADQYFNLKDYLIKIEDEVESISINKKIKDYLLLDDQKIKGILVQNCFKPKKRRKLSM